MRRKQTYEVDLRRAIRKTGVGRGEEGAGRQLTLHMKNNFFDTKRERETCCVLRPLYVRSKKTCIACTVYI